MSTRPCMQGSRMLALCSTQVRQEAARYAFAHGDDARVGAHVVLAVYLVGRDASKAWTALPKVHPLHQMCSSAHAMLMRNPVFPFQPWYWDAVEADGLGGDGTDGHGAGRSGVDKETGAGASNTGKERVYNVRKLQGLVRHLVCAGLLEAAQQLLTDLEYLTIKFEARRVYELVEEFEVLRVSKKAHGRADSCYLDAAGQFETFVLHSRSLFEREPHLLFQAAANTQEDGPMSRAATLARSLHRRHPPWLRWVNAPCDNDVASCWTLQAHKDRLMALAVSPDGAWLATASADRLCRIWETASGINTQTLARSPARIACMAWSPDSHNLAVGDLDGCVKMWRRKRPQTASSSSDVADFGVTAHNGPVQALAFAESSPAHAEQGAIANKDAVDRVHMILSAGTDGLVKVWSTATNSVIRVLKGHQSAVHGLVVRQTPAAAPGTGFMARIISQRLARRREQLGQRKSPHKGRLPPIKPQEHANGFTSVMQQRSAANDDAKIEGREGARVLSFGEDRCVREWQVDSGLCVRTFEGHQGAVMSVDIAEELDLMVSASEDKTCFMWRLSDGSVVGVVHHDTPLSCVLLDLASDSLATICKEGRLRLWDLHSMVRVGNTDAVGLYTRSPGQHLEGLNKASTLVRGQGLVLVGTPGGCVKAFPIRAFSFRAHALAFQGVREASRHHTSSPSSKATDSRKPGAGTGDTQDGEAGATGVWGKGVTAVCVNRCSMCTASASGEIAIWNLKTGDNLFRLASGHRRITALAIEPSIGRLLASASSHGEVLFWDLEQKRIREPIAALAAHVHEVTHMAFSGDGGLFLTASLDKTLRIWAVYGASKSTSTHVPRNAAEQAHLAAVNDPDSTSHARTHPAPALSAATSGLSAASSDGYGGGSGATLGGGMVLRLRALHRLVGHDEAVTSAAFVPIRHLAQDRSGSSAGGALLASSSLDGSVRLWNLATGEPLLPLIRPMGRSGSIACVAWAPDAQHVAGGCDDGSVRVWSLKEINATDRKSPKKAKAANSSHAEARETLILRDRGPLDVLCASLKTLSPTSLADLMFLSLAPTGVCVCVCVLCVCVCVLCVRVFACLACVRVCVHVCAHAPCAMMSRLRHVCIHQAPSQQST
jgi:WD40 repeat protein